MWGGDIRRFHPPAGRFDGVIGGPPCQAFSRLAHMVRQNGLEPRFGNLIPEFERCVAEAAPAWFLMENVPDAPIPAVAGYGVKSWLLNNRELGEVASRERRWSFGCRGEARCLAVETVPLLSPEFAYCGGDPATSLRRARGKKGTMPWNHKGQSGFRDACKAQGLPTDFLADAPFTVEAKCKLVRNGVPLPMGRAIARAVKEATTT